ncbi:hypothetical protein DM01DRAFT_1339408 [Hesseltinella vesiculosa]|uniref:A-kinase anchor protein 7-like phosphoesterase domain-containing protein n=1 Tax=Hesseltinella vesiculosa TaxID=101127 RepID=A0A1X2G715_9FUNG|nr:hypothetical protein DM01DRAFT_1339408 [Hesseltinella vesiculosa]
MQLTTNKNTKIKNAEQSDSRARAGGSTPKAKSLKKPAPVHPYRDGNVASTHSLIFSVVVSPALAASHRALVTQHFFSSLYTAHIVPFHQLHVTVGNLHLPTAAAVHEAQRRLHEQISQFVHENGASCPIPISLEGLEKNKSHGSRRFHVLFANVADKSGSNLLTRLQGKQLHARKRIVIP